ncbi:hypothetical protein [Hyphomicrobium sp. NDB2Meth4]|uniref:hypothetical protein n=1 Tax=Hyphomicrobium sp. NDB2Meth4 TaxID=1892846 RepID=UPI000931FD10|nr:hypothetical protein [Hyphomicrobium sp. NDB2Meth4]
MPPVVLGGLIVGVPALIVAWLLLFNRARPVFWFAVALILVGLGYLGATGALVDIADAVVARETAPLPTAEPQPVSP